ncbi:hypothetical protein Tfer_3129 [Thermincola ferriacetica]|uniref:Uncharacterized protein n=1 Tax=Thermincola ferriacetica TaxID=281456 RepID=A0A0L6VYK7_9FIRM|nr:nodulation protein NfeD [Thermincola ferriacetica]KNZ68345.1 hypothetical protein Tfer_3129 [Thermincola ferriacetica]
MSGTVFLLQRRFRRIAVYPLIILLGLALNVGSGPVFADQAKIVFIPIKGEIEPGMASFVERSLDKAEQMGAKKVVFEIDTPGGLIDSAQRIKTRIFNAQVPTVAFINGEAKSAGVLIALAAEEIYMTPGTAIGAAEPVPNNPKILASWRSDLEEAAEARGRNPKIVAGMADRNVVIENIKEKGEILSLTAKKAVELGIADKIVPDKHALLTELAQKDGVYYTAEEYRPGFGERLAWWIINPFISPILLLIGFVGLVMEAFTLGWGVAGTVGLIALGLFFGGHMMAGVSGWLAVLIFGLGIIALMLEIFVIPGFGVAGVIGIGLVIWSIFLVSTSPLQAIISLSVAFAGTIILLYVLIKVMGRRGIFDRLVLGLKLDKDTGYVAPKKELENLLGLEGVAVTPLRPAGTAEFSGQRVDVVTEGGFIPAGKAVKVILVEGGRVVVRSLGNSSE